MCRSAYALGYLSNAVRSLCVIMIAVLCMSSVVSCASAADPSLASVIQALKDQDKDPAGSAQVLKDKLASVKDKNLIPLLLDYLKGMRDRETTYTSVLGRVAFYLERVTGLKSHIDLTFAGPVYVNQEDWEKDVNQWQEWWDVNRNYIYWDEQARSLKVKPH